MEIEVWEVALRVALAAALGALLGLERELSAQPAGLRTHLLVALGAVMFTVAGLEAGAGSDPARVAAQVASGVGFLGAGAILREGASVRGLTTAASLWVAAAVGVACGLGAGWAASFSVGVALIALVGLKRLERTTFPQRRGQDVALFLNAGADLRGVTDAAIATLGDGCKVRSISPAGVQTRVELHVRLPREADLVGIVESLEALDLVEAVELAR